MKKPTCTFSYGGLRNVHVVFFIHMQCACRFFSFIPQGNEKKTKQKQINNQFLNISSFYIPNYQPLASFSGYAGRFMSYLVANPEDRFSHYQAHLTTEEDFNL